MKLLRHCSVFLLSFLFLLIIPFIFSHKINIAYADSVSQYANYATTSVWTNPQNATGSADAKFATLVNDMQFLFLSYPSFNLPAGATINSIGLTANTNSSGNSGFEYFYISDNMGGTCGGSYPTFPSISWQNTITFSTVDSSNCTNWSSIATVAHVNDGHFGFFFGASPNNFSASVDSVIMTVNYTPSNTSTSPTSFLELPFSYTDSFSVAAQNITSFFDHTYPYISSNLTEPSSPTNYTSQVTTFTNLNGPYPYSSHDGYDYAKKAGLFYNNGNTPVLAAAAGTATYIAGCTGNTCGVGNHVVIDHGNGYETLYGHLKDSWIATMSGQQATVAQGQTIGHMGYTGHVDPAGPEGAHIHFGVYKAINGSFWNGNTGPWYGVTDPFGWEPLKSGTKDSDPWENDTFTYNGQQHTGTSSAYLWIHPLDPLSLPYHASAGGLASLGNYNVNLPLGLYSTDLSVQFDLSSPVEITFAGINFQSVGPNLTVAATDTSGNPVTSLSSTYTLTANFSSADISNIISNTLSLYSSEDGVTWTKETTTIDSTNHTATAQINHFSQFALMGEVADIYPPTTTASASGTLGQAANSYTSDVTLTLSASDNATGSGVQFTTYKIDNADWQIYSSPFTITTQGQHSVQYTSEDNTGNDETAKTIETDIDKTAPTTIAALSPSPNGDGTYPNPVTVTLSATASAGFSVSNTYYKIDGGTQQTYSSAFTVSGAGSHTVNYWSVDNAGLTESQNTKTFTIYTMIYDDTLDSGWTDASFNSTNATTTQPANVYSGSVALVSAIGASGGLDFQAPSGASTSGSTTLHFALKASQAGQQYDVYVDSTYGQPLATPVSLANYGNQPNATGWTVYNIPLADLAATNVSLGDIVIHNPTNGDEPIVYVDQVELFNATPTTLTIDVSDDWSSGSINTSKWNDWSSSHASVVSNQLKISSTLSSGYYGVDSGTGGNVYDLTSSYAEDQLIDAGNQSLSSWEAYPVDVYKDSNTNYGLHFFVSNNTVYARKQINGVNVDIHTAAYNSATQKYFRIRESNGTMYWDTSADGSTWTNFTSAIDPFDVTAVRVGMSVGTWQTEATTTSATFDNFNVLPIIPPASSFTENWSSGSINTSKWNDWSSSHASVVSNQLKISSTLSSGYYGIDSGTGGNVYDLTSSYAEDQLIDAGNQSLSSWEVYPVIVYKDSNTSYMLNFLISGNNLSARSAYPGGSTTIRTAAFNSSTEKYFRIKELGGTIYWDTSANGQTWTNFTSTSNPFDITASRIGLSVGTWQTEATTTSATFDNFNILPVLSTSSITDDWSSGSIDTSKWNNWAGSQVSIVSNQIKFASVLGGGYFGVDSGLNGKVYDLTGSFTEDKLVDAGNQSLGSWEAYPVDVYKDSNTNYGLHFFVSNNTVYARKQINGVNVDIHTAAYNSATQKYFRIRESNGTMYWDTSADGSTWTNFTSTANPFDISAVRVGMSVGTWNTETSTTSATFDNFNIAP